MRSHGHGKRVATTVYLTFVKEFCDFCLILCCKNLDILQHDANVVEKIELRNMNICTLIYKNVHVSVNPVNMFIDDRGKIFWYLIKYVLV